MGILDAPPIAWRTLQATYVPSGGLTARLQRAVVAGGCHAMPPASQSTAATHRVPYFVVADCSDISLVWVNYGRDTAGNGAGDLDNSATLTITATVEDPATAGVFYRVTFGGRASGTLDPGGELRADPIGLDLTAGTILWVRTYVSGGTYYCNRSNAQFEGAGLTNGGGWVAGDSTTIGTIADAELQMFGPALVYGNTRAAVPHIVISGDSIAAGQTDGNAEGGNINGTATTGTKGGGWAERAFAGQRTIVNISSAGERGEDFAKNARHFRRARWILPDCWLLAAYGRNDVSASRTQSVLQSNLIAHWRMGQRRGAKVAAATITPLTTSTDSWATEANQAQPNATQEAVRVAVNTWLRDGAPMTSAYAAVPAGTAAAGTLRAAALGHPLSLVIDVADAVESARNSGVWKAGYCRDGTHPKVAGHRAMAQVVDVSKFV